MTPQFDQPSHSIVHDLIYFYRRKSQDCIQRVVQAIQHIVANNLIVEINLLVNLLEFVGREIIVQHRMRNRGRCGVFNDSVVPHSWALDLIKRPPLIAQTNLWLKNLMEYLGTLYNILESLREYNLGLKSSFLYSFHGKATLNLLGRGILIERICRLIVLELTRLLSLTNPFQQPRPGLNPRAEPFDPELSSQPFSMKETKLPNPEQVLGFEEQHTADSTSSDSCAAHFDSLSETSSRPVLTPDEVESGKKILLAYRRYIQRRLQSAAKTIWSYYSRYRHIKNKRAVMESQSLKLRREYEKYIVEPEGPLLSPRLFSRHKTILLRCMPHVVLFLRGLEHVNQLQKQLNRERLRNTRAEERQAVRAKMHESSQFTRKLRRLMSSIMPGSGNFLQLNALQAHVKEISSIYQEVQEAFGKAMKTVSLEQHYYRGVAVILAQPTHQ
ncbi:unnamed protein product [Rhizoctonia solani]|uniref:Uncharacterized protein n=1 Tax=Rhizoctonia solani TaxID=456999 RepID=A0A8H3H6U7_9AGAM|nr:unnamed protein product [Rhizoctonia solani]